MAEQISMETARRIMLRAAALDGTVFSAGLSGVAEVLERLGEVQLDPIDRVGTSPDLVFHARVAGLSRGDWSRTMPGGAFEHFAKERCLLPARRFPDWRSHTAQAPWWRLPERLKRLDKGTLDDVLAELKHRGPLTAQAFSDHGRVRPVDWSGWTGTGKAATMALEVLWTRCEVVVAGRGPGNVRVYDLPQRALPAWFDQPPGDFFVDGVMQRVATIGMLRTAGGPQWSALSAFRKDPRLDELTAAGALVHVQVPGSRRVWLTTRDQLDAARVPIEHDDHMRVLAPLDPLLWDRDLVKLAFGFDYVWEVYKPADKRIWGYYVCPLLHRGELVGRVEAVRRDGGVVLDNVWWEEGQEPRPRLLDAALARLSVLNGMPA